MSTESAPWRRQSSQLSGGSTPGSPQGDVGVVVPPPPPPCPPAPPPPPPLGSSLPSVRLTSEIGDSRRSCHEPPAAIQNAMMTKDKKPFTYTPGGLDLSEIRSPRMARRITRNANAPDTVVPQPAKTSPLANSNQPLPPSAVAAMQPQIAIPVFPQGGVTPQLHHVTPGGHTTPPSPPSSSQPPPPPPPPQQYTPPTPPAPPQQSPPAPMSVPKLQPQHRQTKSEPQQNTPGSLYVPPIQSQQQQPQQQTARSQLGSLYIPPLNAQEQRATATPTSQSPVLNKAPTPWMSKQSQQQKEVPAWVNREDNVVSSQSSNVASPPDAHARIIPIQIEGRDPPQQSAPFNATANTTQVRTSTNTTTGGSTAGSPGTRIIPIQIEGASLPQQNKQQPTYQQQQRQSGYQQQYQPPQQQQQYQPPQQQQQYHPPQQQQQYQPQQQHQQSQQYQPQQQQQHSPQQRWMNQQPVYVHNKFNTSGQPQLQQVQPTTPSGISHAHNNHSTVDGSSNGSNNPRQLQTQQSWGNSGNTHSTVNGTTSNPVQSRSFRVLQKITDTEGGTDQMDAPYNTQGVPLSQLRKLQLSEDDRALMNKVKTQVDEENYLHNESDPRYRGASIPSRAFRMLQSMTDSAGSDDMEVPRAAAQVQAGQNRLSANRVQQESQPQPYIPPSEQQVQEPRKYTGGAIPSRSFRMLQAMTAGPDNTAVVTDGRQTPQYVNGGDGMWVPPSYNYPIALPPPVPPLSTPHGYYPQFYPPQTPEEHQQFWDHYAQMCAYLAEINAAYGYMGAYPTMYSPSPMVHYASDSDECGYSSTDEMTYYGSIFKRYPPPVLPYRGAYPIENRSVTPQIVITPSNYNEYKTTEKTISSDHLISEECFENGEASTATDGSDTEVENDSCTSPLGLQTIRSVPDIRIYKDSSCSDVQSRYSETDEHESEDDNDDEDDDNEEDDEPEENSSNSNIPHQLSIIFEESEQSSEADTIKKVKDNCVNQIKITSDCDEDDDNDSDDDNDESSTATLDHIADTDNCDDDDDDVVEPEATVVVRLPLKLQFSRSDNNEDVTTVIVGDSEVESSPEVQSDLNVQPSFEVKNNEHKGDLIIQEVRKVEEPEVSVTFSFPKKKLSVKEMVQRIESIKDTEQTEIKNKEEKKHRSESPVDFWKMLGNDDTNSLKMSEDSSSASIAVSPSKMSQHTSFDNFTSESEESRPEESDGGHWEDDSSSTSVQTVKIGKVFSGSENFSADEMAGTADEVDDIQVQNKLLTDNNNHDKTECDKSDDSSSSSDEESTSSASSTSNSSSSGSSCDDSKQTEEANTVSTISTDSNKNDSKLDDDVFVPEVISNVPKNTNTNKNGVTNNINSNNNNNNNNSLCIKKKKERQNCDNGQDDSEEDDSGVTSDMSRHISETDTDVECGSELRKMSRYQRAATHSRLFKLLQDECNGDAAENDDCGDEYWKSDDMTFRKEQLTLPLKANSTSDPDSLSSSSGVNSPSSPTVSDRLVKELVKSLLQKKKGRVFRKLPLKKLHAAALRILQEDMDPYDTVSSTSDDSSFVHSPVSSMPSSCEATTSEANNNAAIQQSSASPDIYGGNYYDYCDYYNTWRDPWYHSGIEASLGNDIVPSRAFRLLQEHAQNSGFRGGLIEGLWAKCPRVVSSKNIPKDLRTIQNDKNPQTSSSTET